MTPSRRPFPLLATAMLLAGLALMAGLFPRSHAQLNLKATRGFRVPIFAKAEDGSPSQMRALITGDATVVAGLFILVRDMVIYSFAEDGSTNVIARAEECLFNRSENTATSTNQLHVDAGLGQLQISGRGFLLNLTNSTLFLSNDVRTVIRASFLEAARRAKPSTAGEALQALPGSGSAETNQPVLIHSDQLNLVTLSNFVTYEGSVLVESPQLDMSCDTLFVEGATNGSIRQIVAESNVVVRSKEGAGTARGERARYTTAGGMQLMTLTGAPARWEEGLRQGEAALFVIDLENNILQAEHGASVRLPRQGLDRTDWVLSADAVPRPQATNPLVSISAELLTVHLPTPLRPGRSVLAQTNVLILSDEDGSQAGADRALYAEITGTVELEGQAYWSSEDRVIRADSLFLDRSNGMFRASGHAYLRLPLGAISRQTVALPGLEPGPANSANPAALEVNSLRYDYRDGVLTFREAVRAQLLETNRVTTRLNCGQLTVHGTNRLDQVYALEDVHLEQLPHSLADGRIIQRNLECQWLALLVDTNGQLDRILARTNVVAEEYQLDPAEPEPSWARLKAEEVTAEFAAGTNQFKRVLAERDVQISQGARKARGERALLENQLLTLTGRPSLETPDGKIPEASSITYDLVSKRFSIQQLRAEGSRLPGQTVLPPPLDPP